LVVQVDQLKKERKIMETMRIMKIELAIEMIEGVYDDVEDHEVIAAWQYLIDIGLVWKLQGYFGRQAARLIEDGVCTP
tara:strand:+ start:270 stop:503 length:234 start_codon:yes stop_codon:yes gene_type:complete